MSSVRDRVAIVTGGGRGIGKAVALALAAEGAKVAVTARTADEIEAVADLITKSGGQAAAIKADITVEEDVKRMVRESEEALGPIDILVNNAAILKLRTIAEMPTDMWDEMMSVNLRSIFLTCREVLPAMMKRRSGRIINVGSSAGRRGYVEQGAYCTTKHALMGLTKVIALEAKDYGIRVQVLSPGGVVTGLSEELRQSRGGVDESDWMTPEEVAEGCVYLCKQEGAAFTDELILRRYDAEPWR